MREWGRRGDGVLGEVQQARPQRAQRMHGISRLPHTRQGIRQQ